MLFRQLLKDGGGLGGDKDSDSGFTPSPALFAALTHLLHKVLLLISPTVQVIDRCRANLAGPVSYESELKQTLREMAPFLWLRNDLEHCELVAIMLFKK